MAQSLGFEPRVGYQPTHDFQSCALDHSANSASSVVCCGGSTATMIIIAMFDADVKRKFRLFTNNFALISGVVPKVNVDLLAKILYNRSNDNPAKGGSVMDLFDLIGPVMIGPSSSHTAGAARIGLTARMLLGEEMIRAEIGLHGSFAKTYRGHGTDRALVGGLMGMNVDDVRLRESLALAQQAGISVNFYQINIRGAHPNTVRLTVTGKSGRMLVIEAASVGGGNIEVHKIDGLGVNFTGKENTMIIRHTDVTGAIASITGTLASKNVNIANVQGYRRQQGGDAMIVMELDGVPDAETLKTIESLPGVQGSTFLARRSDV